MLLHFQNCVPEAPRKIEGAKIPSGWPQKGAITFRNYHMRYRENTPIVLNNLNMSIAPNEKIGIVGRTGSGECHAGQNSMVKGCKHTATLYFRGHNYY